MASPIDQLIVEIRAETADLRKGLDRVNKHLEKTNKTAKSSLVNFRALAGVLAGLGIGRFVQGVIQTSRTFEDLKATIQDNTGTLAETEQAFESILDFTKTTTFQIEQVTRAFIEFRRLGITMTRDQMEGIGNVAAANNRSIDEMAQAIFRASTTSMESLMALGFTGEMAGDMITLRFGEKGAAGTIERTMKKTTSNVIDFVKEVGETKFPTALEDRLNTLSGSFSNLGDKVSIFQNAVGQSGLNKSLIELSSTFQDVLADTSGEDGLAEMLGTVLAGAVDSLNTTLRILDENATAVKVALQGVLIIGTLLVTKAVFVALATSLGVLTTAMNAAKKAIAGVRTALIGLMAVAALNPAGAIAVGIGAVAGGAAIVAFKDEIMAAINELVSEMDAAFEGAGGDENGDGKIADKIISEEGTEKVSDRLEKLREDFKKLEPVIMETANAMANQFVESLMDGENAMDSFKNLFKDMVRQIIAAAMQMMVIKPIMDAIFTSMGFTPIPAAAGGGTIQGGQPTLVGERGPEIFVPNTGGTIMNNMNAKNAMSGGGGVTVIQNNNFALGVGATARAEVQKMLPQIAETSKMAVLEASARGGSFRKALVGG